MIIRLCALLFSLLAFTAQAHEARPVYIKIQEQQALQYQVLSKLPPSIPSYNHPTLQWPEDCAQDQDNKVWQCQQPLQGKQLTLHYPLLNPSVSALLQLQLLDGSSYSKLLGPEQNNWDIPASPKPLGVALDYTGLGITHILAGWDHLLFVACLIFIAATPRRILITLTGFTVAHSITLALSTLDIFRLPVPAVEAIIALSIVLLGRELVKNQRQTLTWRTPVAVACAFGLLHGFGFAAVLAEIGLPQREVPLALLSFNIGVELGQLLFVAFLVLLHRLIGQKLSLNSLQKWVGYGSGILASFWLLQRVAQF
jgi:hydrogenase/urease accessory protein HupE